MVWRKLGAIPSPDFPGRAADDNILFPFCLSRPSATPRRPGKSDSKIFLCRPAFRSRKSDLMDRTGSVGTNVVLRSLLGPLPRDEALRRGRNFLCDFEFPAGHFKIQLFSQVFGRARPARDDRTRVQKDDRKTQRLRLEVTF